MTPALISYRIHWFDAAPVVALQLREFGREDRFLTISLLLHNRLEPLYRP